MKIFAAGIATETNTFCPIPTVLEDFRIQRGSEGLAGEVRHPTLDLTEPWGHLAKARGDEFVFSLMAYADPAGATVDSAYEALREEILRDLRDAMPVDVVLLMLHGAMVAQSYDDCEQDLIDCVRATVGSGVAIGVEMDLHCHLSDSKIAAADLVITYKEYPHSDSADRARDLFNLAVATRLGKIRPTMALFECRMVGLYPTSRSPMREFVDELTAGEKQRGVLSISFGHGFQFADVPHVGAKILAVTDGDYALASRVAEDYAMKVYALRHEIGCESFSLPLDDALTRAIANTNWPVVVADQSDNPGGGAPADATHVLRWLLEHRVENVGMAFFYDPEVVRIARRAGRGARLPLRLGGKLSSASGSPVDLDATVVRVIENYCQPCRSQGGTPECIEQGAIVALHAAGIDLIVTNGRGQCFSPAAFRDCGIEPRQKRLLILKSAQHFYEEFAPISGEVIYMSAPGAVAPDPRQIRYRRVMTHRLYPWTADPFDQ